MVDIYLMVANISRPSAPDSDTAGRPRAVPTEKRGEVMFDYEILRLIWWAAARRAADRLCRHGRFDLGAAALLPFVGRSDTERRVVINTVGPVWEGNQVWLILGGGAIFAAWPPLYAVAFSGFYLAMFVVLCSLILRPVGFKFRSKMPDARWRAIWDWCLFIGGVVPPVIFGVAFGNVFRACRSPSTTACA